MNSGKGTFICADAGYRRCKVGCERILVNACAAFRALRFQRGSNGFGDLDCYGFVANQRFKRSDSGRIGGDITGKLGGLGTMSRAVVDQLFEGIYDIVIGNLCCEIVDCIVNRLFHGTRTGAVQSFNRGSICCNIRFDSSIVISCSVCSFRDHFADALVFGDGAKLLRDRVYSSLCIVASLFRGGNRFVLGISILLRIGECSVCCALCVVGVGQVKGVDRIGNLCRYRFITDQSLYRFDSASKRSVVIIRNFNIDSLIRYLNSNAVNLDRVNLVCFGRIPRCDLLRGDAVQHILVQMGVVALGSRVDLLTECGVEVGFADLFLISDRCQL